MQTLIPPNSPPSLFPHKQFHSPTATPSHSRKPSTASTALKTDPIVPSLPQLSLYAKIDHISEHPITTERTLADVELYKFSIPPDLLNVLAEHSERPNTIQILKTGKGVQRIIKVPATERRPLPVGQIKRNDSIESVRFMLNQRIKEYERQKKDRKLKGSMYVNDLWGKDYEKNIVKATHVDTEISKEISHTRRPLGEKIQDLVTIYEKKNYGKPAEPQPVEKIASPKLKAQIPVNEQQHGNQRPSLYLTMKTESGQPTSNNVIQSAFTRNRLLSRLKSIDIPPAIAERNLTEGSLNEILLIKQRMRSEGLIFEEASPINMKKKSALRVQTEFDAPIESGIPTLVLEDDSARSPIMKNSAYHKYSRSALTSRPGIYNKAATDWKQFKGVQFSQPKDELKSARSPKSISLKNPNYYMKSMDLLSPQVRSPVSKKVFDESDAMLENLIGKCNTELDEKSECIGMLNELGQMFEMKKIRARKRDAVQNKVKIIEDCKYMLEKRDKSEKKRADPNWKALE